MYMWDEVMSLLPSTILIKTSIAALVDFWNLTNWMASDDRQAGGGHRIKAAVSKQVVVNSAVFKLFRHIRLMPFFDWLFDVFLSISRCTSL